MPRLQEAPEWCGLNRANNLPGGVFVVRAYTLNLADRCIFLGLVMIALGSSLIVAAFLTWPG